MRHEGSCILRGTLWSMPPQNLCRQMPLYPQIVVLESSVGALAKYCNLCMCVCVCPRGYLRNNTCDLYQFLCMLLMDVARFSSGFVAIYYVLLGLWMTLCFLSIMGRIAV